VNSEEASRALCALMLSITGLTTLLSCQLDAPPLPTSMKRSTQLQEVKRPPQREEAPQGTPSAQLTPWEHLASPPTDLIELRKTVDRRSLPTLSSLHHLCLGLGKDGPPTIAWLGSVSPALTLPMLPSDAQGALLLLIDWDQPAREAWRRLNETYRGPLSSGHTFARASHVLWALTLPRETLSAWTSARSGYTLPIGLGGRGAPFQVRPLQRGTYQALNDYSDWFSHAPLRAPSQGYAGPCVPRLDPRPHQISALAFALKRPPDLPSEGSPVLRAEVLISRSLPHALAVSRFDWQARLVHDDPERELPLQP